jgi:hypothetical protein
MMTQSIENSGVGFFESDAWRWWQARRFRYNVALVIAGWLAYGADLAVFEAFGRHMWRSWQGGVAMTLFLGTLYLLFIFIANVAFLLGPLTETWVEPSEVDAYRPTAWRMGLWGSFLLPFASPLVNLAFLIGHLDAAIAHY